MERRFAALILFLAILLSACGGNPAPTNTPNAETPTAEGNTGGTGNIIADQPTPQTAQTLGLPTGTLILTQANNALARTPDQQVLALPPERTGSRAAPNGRYGVRLVQASSGLSLELVDFASEPPAVIPIPEGTGLRGPDITWKPDSSGFAFYDFPLLGQQVAVRRTIFYYSLADNETRPLIPDVTARGQTPGSVAFSPDGNYLLYVIGSTEAEGVGGPGSQPKMLNLTSNQVTNLPPDSLFGQVQWLRDNTGFLVLQFDPADGTAAVYRYDLESLTAPVRLTPQGQSDTQMDLAPDGRRLVVTSTGALATGATNIYMMGLAGEGRDALTEFADPEQTITGLVWSVDGIYYSLSGADNQGAVWRMDLDGSNATQIGTGTLQGIVGAG